ncbi:MAG TPA: hypothetical protein VFB63_13830 [Bryobacteraceae bacterium]|jgi:hypothetical protein|nr:hypothetical protein [Bryobacteraceae bacterium]
MSVLAAGWMAAALGLYAGIGLVFAIPFLAWGLPRIDAAARGSSLAFRLFILPGVATFWPLLLRRWLRSAI